MSDTQSPRIKSPKAFRTISEAAGELDLPQHVLRFWETKFPQIKPMKRAGGRRFYRPEDVEFLARIKTLLHTEGYTIKGVQKLLRQNGAHNGIENIGERENYIGPSPSQQQSEERQALMTAEINATINTLEGIRDNLISVKKSS